MPFPLGGVVPCEPLPPPLPPPLVKPYSVCSCQDSTNNTYACVRTLATSSVGATVVDSLFCQFDDSDGFEEYYDMTGAHGAGHRDLAKWQLRNEVSQLTQSELSGLRDQLSRLRTCKGTMCYKYK